MEIAPPRLPADSAPDADPALLVDAEEVCDAVFRGAGFSGVVREHLIVDQCIFSGCRFSGAVLEQTRFSDVLFRNCDFSNAYLRGCSFQRVRFLDCKLTGLSLIHI